MGGADPLSGARAGTDGNTGSAKDERTDQKDVAGKRPATPVRRLAEILKAFRSAAKSGRVHDWSDRPIRYSSDLKETSARGLQSSPSHPGQSRPAAVEEQGLLWGGFAFSIGILIYMALPAEPSFWALAGLFLVLFFILIPGIVRGRSGIWALLILAGFAGTACASLRTLLAEAPRLAVARTVTLEARVIDRQMTGRGPRLVLSVLAYEDRGTRRLPGDPVGAGNLPERVRLSAPKAADVRIGDGLRMKARLFPPSGPVRPGGYDFSFWAYFQGLGATGFVYGVPVPVDFGPMPTSLWFQRQLDDLRSGIGRQIRSALEPGDSAELAAALLVGDRSGLSDETEDILRQAGLAHVLAISGLHMALFAGGAYAAILLVLSFWEAIALRWPSHKLAACVALLAAIFYLGISGGSLATQRSFVMIGLVFLGLIVSRKGLTLHSVALAGLLLLILAPERLLHPGFQMSFAAVICLVAVYETWRTSSAGRGVQALSMRPRFWSRIGWQTMLFWGGLTATALVAGLATGVIGVHHFGRIAPMGVIGNLLGMPVFTLLIMPMGVLALVLMPFGLASLPLQVMSAGLDVLLGFAEWTANLDIGQDHVSPPGANVTLLLMAALFLGVLARGWIRLGALPLGIIAGAFLVFDRPPDIQISEKGAIIAARGADGILRFSAKRAGFETDIWLQREGLPEDAFSVQKMGTPQRRCDPYGCVYLAYAPMRTGSLMASDRTGSLVYKPVPIRIAMPQKAEALAMDCIEADIIVTELTVPKDCDVSLVIGAAERRAHGALSLWLEAADWPASNDRSVGGGNGKSQLTNKEPTENWLLGFTSSVMNLVFGKTSRMVPASNVNKDHAAASDSVSVKTPPKTVITKWLSAKTRPPRPWHRPRP
ncbi:ComEC/Rec2 family competence protein [Roseibium algae]|uniref:ComEC/Rec2 family competence protein n=1 Tax=Roseibium algae TaxID=3123038 RepID=A0ABU8TJF8_9HYPH